MWPGAACPGGAGNPIKNLPGRSVPCTCWGQGWGEQQLGPTGTHCILQVAGKNNPCLGQLQLLLRVIPSQLIPALPCLSLELGSLLVAFPTWERCWELSVPTFVLPGLAGVPCVGTVLLCVALPAQHLPELGGASRPFALLSPSRVSPRNADCFGFSGHSTATGHKGLSVSERSASSFLWILESFWGLLWPLIPTSPVPSCPQAGLELCPHYPVAQGTVPSLWGVGPPNSAPGRHRVQSDTAVLQEGWLEARQEFPILGVWQEPSALLSLCSSTLRCCCPPQLCPWQEKLGAVALFGAGNAPWLCPCSNCRDKMLLCHTPSLSHPAHLPLAFLSFLSFFFPPSARQEPSKQRLW